MRKIFLFKSFVRLPFSSYSYSVCWSAPSMKLNAPCHVGSSTASVTFCSWLPL